MKSRTIPGVNIQYPISQLILSGQKTVETRTYPIPDIYIETAIALIETPGAKGAFNARIVAVIEFGPSFEYKNEKDFYEDSKRHFVEKGSKWSWKKGQKKFGWPIKKLEVFSVAIDAPLKKGIVFTKSCDV